MEDRKRTWVVIASGQSLTEEDVEYVHEAHNRGNCSVAAVSNVGIDLAPWADILVSHDSAWWKVNRQAKGFKGRKFSRQGVPGCEVFIPMISQACNSGLMAMDICHRKFGAEKIIILGMDMKGTHYFGPHPDCLINTTEKRFEYHIQQFNIWNGCEVLNATRDTALEKFPLVNLRDVL